MVHPRHRVSPPADRLDECAVRRLHAARASLAVNTTDLQQELPEAHLPLVERCGPFAMASSDLDVVSRNRVSGAFDPDETDLVVTEGV